MKPSTRALLLLAGLILAFLVLGLLGRDFRSRRALRNYQAQLRASGEKLSYQELIDARKASTNSSLAGLTNAVARLRAGQFKPWTFEPRQFVRPGYARAVWMQPAPPPDSRSGEGVLTWEALAAELETNRIALQDIRDALVDPAPDLGARKGLLSAPTHSFIAIRSAAQWLTANALVSLHQGQRPEALVNLLAVASLARVNRDEYSLVSQMIRVAVARLGLVATWEVLQAPDWTDAELLQLQRAWEAVDLFDGLERAFLGERAAGSELWAELRSSRSPGAWRRIAKLSPPAPRNVEDVLDDYVFVPVYKMTSIDEDQLFHLKLLQQCVECVRSLRKLQPWSEAKPKLDQTIGEVDRIGSSLARFRFLFSLIVIPNINRAAGTAARAETERQLTISAIALKRYRLRHGKFPPELGALVPEFLCSLPSDSMSGKAPGYRLKADGDFVLYSVGEDGLDDGGDPRAATPGASDMWDGRDVVWPALAGSESRAASPQ